MDFWSGPAVWEHVASTLRSHRAAGLAGLLTEDTVRFALAQALLEAGVAAEDLRVEWPHPVLAKSRIDLVVGRPDPSVLIELKFPREPNETNAAWTQALGEVLKDYYRLAVVPGHVTRLFVLAESARLRRYLSASAQRYGLQLDLDDVVLHPGKARGLPETALRSVGSQLVAHHVTARRLHCVDVDDTLRLSVFDVHASVGASAELSTAAAAAAVPVEPGLPAAPAGG